jgi:hypothetical protein
VRRILNGGGGKRGEKVSLCKDIISSCPPASEKRKSLSAIGENLGINNARK